MRNCQCSICAGIKLGRWTRPLLFVLLAVAVMALCSSCAPSYYRSRQFNDLTNTPTTWRLGK